MMIYSTRYTHLSFGLAFDIIREDTKKLGMRLPSWKEDVIIRVQMPDENSKMTAPYLYVESRFGRVPWKETMIELFSKEWVVVEIKAETINDICKNDEVKAEDKSHKVRERRTPNNHDDNEKHKKNYLHEWDKHKKIDLDDDDIRLIIMYLHWLGHDFR